MSAGTADAPGLLFDMNKLFEAYVTRLEETASDDHQYVHSQKPQITLATLQGAGVFTLKPDITVWQTEPGQEAPSITRIVDAKWKRLSPLALIGGWIKAISIRCLLTRSAINVITWSWSTRRRTGLFHRGRIYLSSELMWGMIPSELSGSTSGQLRSGEHRGG